MNKNIAFPIIILALFALFTPQAAAQNNRYIALHWESHNQDEAARTLSKLAARRAAGDKAFWDIFNAIAQEGNPKRAMQGLDSISGQFLAQTIARMAFENPGISVYPRIKRNTISWLDNNKLGDRQLYFHALWIEPFISEAVVDGPKNRSGQFRDSRFGARGGLSIVEDSLKAAGIFWSANKTQIRQERNSANIDSFEGGLYAGAFRGLLEHKLFISGSLHNVESERFIDLHDAFRPEASFSLFGIKYGFESSAELPYYIPKTSPLLFAGAYRANIQNPQIQESGGGMMNLTVESHNYERIAAYLGIRLEGDWWYASGQVNYFLKGKNNESRFDIRWNEWMAIEGANNELISFAINAGIDKEVEKDIFFYAALEAEIGRNFYEKSFGVKGGIKYMFADRYSAPFYKAYMSRLNLEKRTAEQEKRLERQRQERQLAKEARERRIEREVSEYEKTLELKRMIAEEQSALRERSMKAAQERDIKAMQMKAEQDRQILAAQERQIKAAQDRRNRAVNSYKFKAGFFEADSAVLLPHAIGNIKTLAADIKGKRFKMITVEGHSDPTGSKEMSLQLSLRRASAIYDELIRNGLPRNKIAIIGFGDRMPIADNATEEGRAANRRVEIFVE